MVRGSALCALNGEKPALGRDAILKLMKAVDEYIPLPQRAVDKPFQMPIEDVFSIAGRGTVVTGRVEQGAWGRVRWLLGGGVWVHGCARPDCGLIVQCTP